MNMRAVIEPWFVKREISAFAKSIDLCQPAQSAQADMGRNFSLSVDFFFFFCMSKDNATSLLSRLFDKIDFMDP